MASIRSAMTVAQLIAALKDQDPKAQVFFSYDYGDHSHTNVAAPVANVDEQSVVHSEYHNMPKVADSDEGAIDAVVLS